MAKKPTSAKNESDLEHPLLAQFSEELLTDESMMDAAVANLREFVADTEFQAQMKKEVAETDEFWPEPGSWLARYRPYEVENGVLTLHITGTLVTKGTIQYGGYVTGYEYLARAIERARQDPEVQKVALRVDSPGGHVAENFELAESMRKLADEKEVWAFVEHTSASAAYSLTSAARHIVASKSAMVGSIGILYTHVSREGALKKAGIKVTSVYAGNHKIDGSPYKDLTEQARARKEDRVNKLYGQFVQIVANNRDMTEEAVRGTEALVYDSDEALEIGLVDEVGNIKEMLAEFAATATEGVYPMSRVNQSTSPTAEQANGKTYTDAEIAAIKTEAAEQATTAERERISAIVSLEEAKGKSEMAMKLATTPGITAEAAKGILETAIAPAPASQPAPAPAPTAQSEQDKENAEFRNHFAEQMNANPQPEAGNPAPENGEEGAEADPVDSFWAAIEG